MDYEARVTKLQAALVQEEVDALLVTNLVNVRYLTGFSGTNGQLLVGSGVAQFFSDGRYAARAQELVKGAAVHIYLTRLTDVLTGHLKSKKVTTLGVEAKSMTLAQRDDLDERLEGVELASTSGLVENLRRAKDDHEVELVRRAVAVSDATYAYVLDRLSPGQTEREMALELEVHMRQNGADEVAFEPIVGSGPLSAHIHHTPTERSFEKGDLILLDFGCRVDGYCSDLTRTVVLGAATAEQREVYDTVRAAQDAAQDAMRPGASCTEVDRAARSVIEAAGHADDFGHGLGHGLGLEVHEAPTQSRISEDVLADGDVVTNEPGIYVVDSGGIRIEDCIAVTDRGPQVLTSAPKDELIEL
jgi:Xaa-Pro aminopeptidase